MSESERQRFEDVKQELSSQFKRINLIAGIVLLLLVFVVICLFSVFKKMHPH
jgi:hypothetical protein